MKNKKKILSLIACLSLLSSCNKTTPSSSSCSITTSTPTSNNEDEIIDFTKVFNVANTTNTSDSTYAISSTKDEYKTKLKEVIIPKEINGIKVTGIYADAFKDCINITSITLSENIDYIYYTSSQTSSPFSNLPNLMNITVNSNNPNFYVEGNCLIEKVSSINSSTGEKELTGELRLICGFNNNVTIPEDVTTIRSYAFSKNLTIKTIKLHSNINSSNFSDNSVFSYIDNLEDIDLNGLTTYTKKGNCIYNDKVTSPIAAWKDVDYPSGSNITSFYLGTYSSVTSVTIHDNISQISSRAIASTKIKSITIPKSVNTISSISLRFSAELNEIIVEDGNPNFYVEGNCLIQNASTGKLIVAAYGDVVIPDYITSIENEFLCFYSITSIKLNKNITSLSSKTDYMSNAYDPFRGINDYKTVDNYFKLYVDEENPIFRMKDNCLVTNYDTENETVLIAFPNENGEVSFPSSSRIINLFNTNFTEICNPEDIKSIVFHDNIKELRGRNNFLYFPYQLQCFENLVLPYSLISLKSSRSFFVGVENIKSVTFSNNRTENDTFKIEGNCIIKKNGHIDGNDMFVFGWGDVILPTSVTSLGYNNSNYGTNIFSGQSSITSITFLNNNFKYVEYQTFADLTSSCKEINYYGTLKEFLTKEYINPSYNNITMYKAISYNGKMNQKLIINFFNSDGQKIDSKTMEEIDSIDSTALD